jgi:hypothetical protein
MSVTSCNKLLEFLFEYSFQPSVLGKRDQSEDEQLRKSAELLHSFRRLSAYWNGRVMSLLRSVINSYHGPDSQVLCEFHSDSNDEEAGFDLLITLTTESPYSTNLKIVKKLCSDICDGDTELWNAVKRSEREMRSFETNYFDEVDVDDENYEGEEEEEVSIEAIVARVMREKSVDYGCPELGVSDAWDQTPFDKAVLAFTQAKTMSEVYGNYIDYVKKCTCHTTHYHCARCGCMMCNLLVAALDTVPAVAGQKREVVYENRNDCTDFSVTSGYTRSSLHIPVKQGVWIIVQIHDRFFRL